jgi:hypothetical protein
MENINGHRAIIHIIDAMHEVEKLGCDIALTDAVVALSIAREKILAFLRVNKTEIDRCVQADGNEYRITKQNGFYVTESNTKELYRGLELFKAYKAIICECDRNLQLIV